MSPARRFAELLDRVAHLLDEGDPVSAVEVLGEVRLLCRPDLELTADEHARLSRRTEELVVQARSAMAALQERLQTVNQAGRAGRAYMGNRG